VGSWVEGRCPRGWWPREGGLTASAWVRVRGTEGFFSPEKKRTLDSEKNQGGAGKLKENSPEDPKRERWKGTQWPLEGGGGESGEGGKTRYRAFTSRCAGPKAGRGTFL